MGLLHGGFEGRQVNLAQGPLVNDRICIVAIELRVVGDEMFDSGADALALYALDVTNHHARGEERIFAEVLEVSAVHRSTVNIHPGREQEVHAFGTRVTSEFAPNKFGQ